MTELEHEANEEARHGNREALIALQARCERLEGVIGDVIVLARENSPDEAMALFRAALNDKEG